MKLTNCWEIHVKHILDGDIEMILSRLLAEANPSDKRRRFLSVSHLDGLSSTESARYLRFRAEISEGGKEEERNASFMDDFEQAQEIDRAIGNIRSYVLQWDGYRELYEKMETTSLGRSTGGAVSDREQELLKLGLVLLQSSRLNDCGVLDVFLENDFPVNFQHPVTARTALHESMAFDCPDFARKLMDSGKCDYLIRAKSGSLACDLGFENMSDLGLVDHLHDATTQEANKNGLDVTSLFKHQKPGYWLD